MWMFRALKEGEGGGGVETKKTGRYRKELQANMPFTLFSMHETQAPQRLVKPYLCPMIDTWFGYFFFLR